MHAPARLLAVLALAGAWTLAAGAGDAPGAPKAESGASAAQGTAQDTARDTAPGPVAREAQRAEPRVEHRVIEDDHVRIEELRVRGQTRRITVQSKVQGAREYEILVGHGGRDPSQDRGNAGRAAWRVLGF